MNKAGAQATTLLFAFAILMTGHGLQFTLLPVHALSIGWSSTQIGVTGAAYFVGFITGCSVVPATVSAVGHIRAFMVLAALATASLLTAALLVEIWAWLPLRFATGFALAGLYMIIESWLTDISPREQRGSVLTVYLAVSLLGMAAGQLPLMFAASIDLDLFLVAALLLCVAIIPIGLTRTPTPSPIPGIRVTPATLVRASRVAVVCAVVTGMVNGSFWTLGAVVATELGLDATQVAIFISLGVLGGAFAQLPAGRISDRMDRRIVIAALTATGAVVSALAVVLSAGGPMFLYGAIALLCASSMPVYALCVALATDKTELTVVEVTSGMLLANGIGSVVGPIIAGQVVSGIGARMFFAFSGVCLGSAAVWTVYRILVFERSDRHDLHKPMLPRTTQAVAELVADDGGAPAALEGHDLVRS